MSGHWQSPPHKPRRKERVEARTSGSIVRGVSPVIALTERQVTKIKLEWHRVFGADYLLNGPPHLLTMFEGWIYDGPTDKPEELAQQEAIRYLLQLVEMPRHIPVRKVMTKEERDAYLTSLFGKGGNE
jgi:hypothetical protein